MLRGRAGSGVGLRLGRRALVGATSQQLARNAAIGYVAVHEDQALVGTLWAQADRATSSNVYKLAPCVKIGGRWYLHLPSS